MEIIDQIRVKAKDAVDWLDSVPSVPAAVGGLVVGALLPKTVLVVGVVVGVLWAIGKFGGLDSIK